MPRSIVARRACGVAVALSAACLAAHASADVVAFDFTVGLSDGGTATGRFSYDTSSTNFGSPGIGDYRGSLPGQNLRMDFLSVTGGGLHGSSWTDQPLNVSVVNDFFGRDNLDILGSGWTPGVTQFLFRLWDPTQAMFSSTDLPTSLPAASYFTGNPGPQLVGWIIPAGASSGPTFTSITNFAQVPAPGAAALALGGLLTLRSRRRR